MWMNTNKIITALIAGIFLLLLIQTSIQVRSLMIADKTPAQLNVTEPEHGVPAIKSMPDMPPTSIRFDSATHDFGTIPDTHKVYTQFTFTNTGKEPLMILSAEGSCGCTIPTWPREPLPPGKQGMIEVSFDPNGKSGEQSKIVTITSNTAPTATILTIKATIIKGN